MKQHTCEVLISPVKMYTSYTLFHCTSLHLPLSFLCAQERPRFIHSCEKKRERERARVTKGEGERARVTPTSLHSLVRERGRERESESDKGRERESRSDTWQARPRVRGERLSLFLPLSRTVRGMTYEVYHLGAITYSPLTISPWSYHLLSSLVSPTLLSPPEVSPTLLSLLLFHQQYASGVSMYCSISRFLMTHCNTVCQRRFVS